MNAFKWSTLIYLPWFMYWVIAETLAYFFGPTGILKKDKVPWYTLSEWVWADEQILPAIVYVCLIGFPLLGLHLAHATIKKIMDVFTP